ncbi:MAG: YaeQ family protein [Burkholderiales bacterium]|nr:YaeQ family protein [Burkholderiales bacterium]
MALKSTIFKADLQIADLDRSYYGDHALTIAQHPSETDERMMVRLLAFALHADGALTFGRGLSDEEEPDLWRKDLTGAIQLWIDVGLPDERRVRKASGRSDAVIVYAYGRGVDIWWEQNARALNRIDNLRVRRITADGSQALAALARRTMTLQATVQEGQVFVTDGSDTATVDLGELKAATGRR